ncbi:hypothetical protein [Nonlabens sp. YIK11]|uniref:hypothetical protein n=1 Tax=Nonlabens sp. YIK11 TaxID=1453349 RepID=UPI000A9F472D|nr:hypothetical protein [Nonlabens sp. YIK11]
MKYLFTILLASFSVVAVAQNKVSMSIDKPQSCGDVQNETMTFLVDGSLQSAAVVKREVSRLSSCGLDEYDIRFFGRIESLSTLLKKLTKDKLIDNLTYGDLLTGINDMKQTANYKELKQIALLSQKLAETKGDIRTWETDVRLFQELGASQQVIDKVYKYLREYPENELSYQELLMKIRK